MPAFMNQLLVPTFENAESGLCDREPSGFGFLEQTFGGQRSDRAYGWSSAVRLEGLSVPPVVKANQLRNGQAVALNLGSDRFHGHGLRRSWAVGRRSHARLALSSSGSAGHPSGKRHAQCFKESHGSLPCVCTHISLRYTPPVTSKKGVIGIGLPLQLHDESRGLFSAESAASLSVPPVLAARMGERKLRRFPQGLPGRPTHSSCRPRLVSGAVVVVNRSPWRPFMAHNASAPRCAQIIPLPTALARPVKQPRNKGGRLSGAPANSPAAAEIRRLQAFLVENKRLHDMVRQQLRAVQLASKQGGCNV